MRGALTLLILIECYFSAYSQFGEISLNNEYNLIILNGYPERQDNFHTSIKPYRSNEIDSLGFLIKKSMPQFESRFLSLLLSSDTISPNEDVFFIEIQPLIQAMYGIGQSNDSLDIAYNLGIGLNLSGKFGKRLSFGFDYLYSNNQYSDYVQESIYNKGVVPGLGKADINGNEIRNVYYTGALEFQATDFFNIRTGIGKNFIGNGYRSLILSDNSVVNPFLNLTFNIWKLKYSVLYSSYESFLYSHENGYFREAQKFSTSNFLSMNFGKRINIGLFQTVIWYDDPEVNRGFDMNYLNPFIFLRPVEYSLGSPDNVLMGLDFKYNFRKKNSFYAQLILDEFLLQEIRDNNGWWGNKFGYQIGIKFYDLMRIKGLSLLTEYNRIRPFTYSHSNPVQSYSNGNEALAHSLGANLSEVIFRISYARKNWLIGLHSMIAEKGEDNPFQVYSYGGDIFKSNKDRISEYGNTTGQGILSYRIYQQLKISYLLSSNSRWMLEAGISGRFAGDREECLTPGCYDRPFERNVMFHFGIKTALYNQYLDF